MHFCVSCINKYIYLYVHTFVYTYLSAQFCCCFTEQIEHDCQKMTAWNPMQCDFLLKRNAYSVDDEDVRSAITGYGMCALFLDCI